MTNIFKKAIETIEQTLFFGGEDLRKKKLIHLANTHQGIAKVDPNLTLLEWKQKEQDMRLREKIKTVDGVREELKLPPVGDTRYNEPKGKHIATEDRISETIESTEIYSRAKELILNAQRKQVGYGLDKYPEPLNADTWSTIETIDHIIDESIDKLHYLLMLRIKLERALMK